MIKTEVLNKFNCKQSLITKLNCFIKVLECTHYNPDNYLALYEYMIRYLDSQSKVNRGTLDSKELSKLLLNDIETKYSVFNCDSSELENIRKIKEGIKTATENKFNEFEKCITGNCSGDKSPDNEDNFRYRAFPFTSKTDKGEIYQGLTDYLQDVLCLKRIDSNNARNTASKGHIAIYCERGCYTDDVKEIKSLIKDVLTISKYKSKVNLKQYIDELFSDVNNSPKILQPNVIVVRNGTIIIDMENPLKKDGSPNIEFKPHSPEYISFNPLNCEYLQDVDTKKLEVIIKKYAVNDDTHEVSEATFQNIIQAFALFLNPTNDFKKEPLFTNSNGNNGKSTLLSFLSGLYGSNNCSFKDADQIKGNQFVFADLYGKRINIIDEIEENAPFPIAVIKRITGGSQIPYNQKFEPVFDFYGWYPKSRT